MVPLFFFGPDATAAVAEGGNKRARCRRNGCDRQRAEVCKFKNETDYFFLV